MSRRVLEHRADCAVKQMKFTVDTHLFRELGELLVGRDSTALVELIKNAYDADATQVTVEGELLDDARLGKIIVTDNGTGMTGDVFEKGFLRVAARIKEAGERRSLKYKRRYTGAKGVGRLAAHKLARFMEVVSIPDPTVYQRASQAIEASIDWDLIEDCTTLDEVEDTQAVVSRTLPRRPNSKPGTTIELRRLRRKWTPAERARFFWEVQTFRPPDVLVKLPQTLFQNQLLLPVNLSICDTRRRDPGFEVQLLGDLEAGEEYWQALPQVATWLIEIDARANPRSVHYLISPTPRCLREYPHAEPVQYTTEYPAETDGPHFQARILVREGNPEGVNRTTRSWLGRMSGVRIYMEGFRVLPYGEAGDDWLELDADYKRRSRTLRFLEDFDVEGEGQIDEDEALSILGKEAYFGAAFLTQERSPGLRMLVNREGFVPDAAFDALRAIIRVGIDFSVRVRAGVSAQKRQQRREERQGRRAIETDLPDNVTRGARREVEESVVRATSLAKQARQEAAAGRVQAAAELVEQAATEFSQGAKASERLLTEPSVMRMLAAIGTQMAAFVHEINGLLGLAQSLEEAIARLRRTSRLGQEARQALANVATRLGDLRRTVERQAAYLGDISAPDARRRRSRQSLADRFDAAVRLVAPRAERQGIRIVNEMPRSLKTVPMFPAELTLVFSNLLTNAIKAAGEGGTIRATATSRASSIVARIENTGVTVDLHDAERWFRPFESTTTRPDPYLGQGMGMGLPITRNMLEEYGAEIRFVAPTDDFSTAVQITFLQD